jgi:phage shock protein PspC (stress-responsive transcriptional regulator)
VDVVMVRVIWFTLAICTGVGFLVYIAAWIIMPEEPLAVGHAANEFAYGTPH